MAAPTWQRSTGARGRRVFFSFGVRLAALLGYFIVVLSGAGWRIVQVITAAPILLLLLWWRRSIPESPRFLITDGRIDEAEAVVARMERQVQAVTGAPLRATPGNASTAGPVAAGRANPFATVGRLWRGGLAGGTTVVRILWFAITFPCYGFFTWIPHCLSIRD